MPKIWSGYGLSFLLVRSPDGSLREREQSTTAYAGAAQRWRTVNESLLEEAKKGRRNERGELSLLGQYLESICSIDIPIEIEDLQKAGGPEFGIIDVVLTLGKGLKDPSGAGTVSEPTSLRLSELKINVNESHENKGGSLAASTSQLTSSALSKIHPDREIAQRDIYDMPRTWSGESGGKAW